MADKYLSSSVKETHEIAQKILKDLKVNLICLYGPLGAGKTVFVQGLAKALGVKERVISPSFVLVRSYKIHTSYFILHTSYFIIHTSYLVHVDCYRLRSEKDFKAMDLTEIWSDPKNLVVIEWAEKLKKILPKKRLDIFFKIKGEKKRELKFIIHNS